MSTNAGRVWLAVLLIASGGAVAVGCGDDDASTESPQAELDASIVSSGTGAAGTRSSAGRGGTSSAAAGRGGTSSAGTSGRAPTAGAGTAGTSAAAGGAGAGEVVGMKLTDEQTAAVITAANTGEIELGNLTLRQGTYPDVLAFASTMVMMHTAAQARVAALLVTLSLTPADNAISMQLRQEVMSVSARLLPLTTASFDVEYLEAQIAIHTEVLRLINDVLLPSVTAVQLESELQTMRNEVMMHLAEARALRARPEGDQDAGLDDDGGT
jgi:predicted outer membrane protein